MELIFTILILLILGLFLILLEFYLPGAVMGILGGVAILTSIILFASHTASMLAIALYIAIVIIAVVVVIRFALWRIVTSKPEYSIYLHKDQEGYQASHFDHSAIGKQGVVLADLKPGGYILIEGKQHQAISLEGYISKGTKVVVVSGQEESLLVKLSKKESTL